MYDPSRGGIQGPVFVDAEEIACLNVAPSATCVTGSMTMSASGATSCPAGVPTGNFNVTMSNCGNYTPFGGPGVPVEFSIGMSGNLSFSVSSAGGTLQASNPVSVAVSETSETPYAYDGPFTVAWNGTEFTGNIGSTTFSQSGTPPTNTPTKNPVQNSCGTPSAVGQWYLVFNNVTSCGNNAGVFNTTMFINTCNGTITDNSSQDVYSSVRLTESASKSLTLSYTLGANCGGNLQFVCSFPPGSGNATCSGSGRDCGGCQDTYSNGTLSDDNSVIDSIIGRPKLDRFP
jgi:hypothetical protein